MATSETKPKGADAKTSKVEAANIHEQQNEDQPKVPEHIEGQSQTPKEISDAIVDPPEPNEDEVKGEDNSPIAEPHSADPQADPERRSSGTAEGVQTDTEEDSDVEKLRLPRVSGDEVYGNLGAPANVQDQLASIRKRAEKAGEVGIIQDNVIWTIVGVLAIVALLLFILNGA